MDNFSLLTTPWLPVRFKDGSTGKLAPVDLTDENVVDIAATRADLQGAAWQFLLGLLQCSIAPKRYKNWEDIWFDGLHADVLHKALAPLEHAFQFGAESPSFMQDFEPLSGEKVSIASLLPEIPGAQTTKFNKDHFVKRGVTERFCPHCAALALFSLQLNAPAGGKGYRTGLRGGGPLTTLVELQEYQGERQTPIWRKLWLNVMPQDTADLPLPDQCDATVFPWLAATRTSEQANAVTTPEQVNKLQAYWGMPRRIRLDFATLQSGCCDICGAESDELLGFMTVKNYGVILAAGYAPAIGFIHSGKPLSFVYDIADIIKFESVVPKAFEIAARHPAEPDKEVRLACRDIFRSSKLTGKLIPLIEEVLAAGEIEPPQPAPDMLPPAIPEPESLGDSGHRGHG